MMTAIFNWFLAPYIIAFEDSYYQSSGLIVLSTLIDIVFIVDIVINFRTSFIKTSTGEEIINEKKIAIHYLKGQFIVDFLAAFPFEYFGILMVPHANDSTWFAILGMLKLLRVKKLGEMITHLNLSNEYKIILRLIKLVFFIFLFIHWLACAWFKITKDDEKWLPPLDYVYIVTNLYEEGTAYQYFTNIYHAVLMIGGNDIGPRGEFQLSFVSSMLFVGAIINAIIFGNMAVMLQSLNRKSSLFQVKIETANEAMKNLKLPANIRDDVKFYLSYTQSALNHQKELDSFLMMLSPSLKQKVTSYIFYDTILENPVFENKEEALNTFIGNLQIKLFMPEDSIIKQGEQADWMYFLARGDCNVYVTDSNK